MFCGWNVLNSSRIARIAWVIELVEIINGDIDHCEAILLLGAPLSLPDVSPGNDNDQLGGEEQGTRDDEAERVDATTARQFLFDKDFGQGRIAAIVFHFVDERVQIPLLFQFHDAVGQVSGWRWVEFVDNFNCLDDEHLFGGGVTPGPRQISPLSAVRVE